MLPVSEAQIEYGETVVATLKQAGYRVEIDCTGERLGKQIRNAELEKIPVVAIVGKKEVETQTLSIRTRQQGDIGTMTLTELKESFKSAITNKANI
ncbi:Threonyl-tRNA synthetase [Crocosphaera watsonii WH 0401]|uniref:Threonyl-tRNA synthetase n=1 Tax=Crocosphaera watsonii WH 0401 TaxID=555881 RepID=T2J8E2_CROWT|nr:Threonyl-tRNA synthetase [Crocosphaera watsonii WH 0401]